MIMAHKILSIDIETLGLKPESAILSIGACWFDTNAGINYERDRALTTPVDSDTFYVEIDVSTQSRQIDWNTIQWWNMQTIEKPFHGDRNLRSALEGLAFFIKQKNEYNFPLQYRKEVEKKAKWQPRLNWTVWCKGPQLDIAILENAYTQCGMIFPWKHDQIRDMRTFLALYEHLMSARNEVTAPLHNALSDAMYQGEVIHTILSKTGIVLPCQ